MNSLNVEMRGESIPLRSSEVDEALNFLRRVYSIHTREGVMKELRDGELSYGQTQRILKDLSPIVLQFPDYLEALKESVSRQDGREKHQPVIEWLDSNVREERTHVKLWRDFISAFGITYKEGDEIQNPYISELDGLLWDGARGDSPSTGISRLTLGVEGITGMVIKESYDGISNIYERENGIVLSPKQRRWLNVHKNYDADVHPREAVENIAKLGILPATHKAFDQSSIDLTRKFVEEYLPSLEVIREAQKI